MSRSIAYMSLRWTNWHCLIICICIYIYLLTTKSLIIITLPVQFPIFQIYYGIWMYIPYSSKKRHTWNQKKIGTKTSKPSHHPSPSININHHPSPSPRKAVPDPGPFQPPWRDPGSRQSACAPKTWPWPTSSCGIESRIRGFERRAKQWINLPSG